MSPSLFAWCYIWKALRTRLIIPPIFLFAKKTRCVWLWRCDIWNHTADAILFREIQCKKMDNLMFKQRVQCQLGWNKVKYAGIMITYVCFIALTLAGSLWRCLNTRPIGLAFKQHPRDLANVNAWKNMWSLYLIILMNLLDCKTEQAMWTWNANKTNKRFVLGMPNRQALHFSSSPLV